MSKNDKECKISIRCTLVEKDLFRKSANHVGFRSLSEWIRVAATEYIREHIGLYTKDKPTKGTGDKD